MRHANRGSTAKLDRKVTIGYRVNRVAGGRIEAQQLGGVSAIQWIGSGDETVVMILNKSDVSTTLDLNRFEEMGLNGKTLKNIISGDTVSWNESIDLPTRGVTLLTTKLN